MTTKGYKKISLHYYQGSKFYRPARTLVAPDKLNDLRAIAKSKLKQLGWPYHGHPITMARVFLPDSKPIEVQL
jgi:hypothetical protein